MYITGIGRTKFGSLKESIYEIASHAMRNALSDSFMSVEDIDAIYVSNFLAGISQEQLHLNSVISSLLPDSDIPVFSIETACASGGMALHQAVLSQHKYKTILVLGVEKMTDVDGAIIVKSIGEAGDRILDQSEGLTFPATYALVAQQHMIRYGTTPDDLALVSLKNHLNANLNELSHFYHKTIDIDDISASQMVASPLRLFDCSPVSDGGAAIILSKEKRNGRDVKVLASEVATDSISLSQRKELTTFHAAKKAGEKAYLSAKLRPEDIDLAEVHDCFTIAELIAMEDLGFCKPGESKEWIRAGRTKRGGDLPINTDGGLKADGHAIGATGIAQVYEAVVQLRGEAGKRQVAEANISLCHNVGGVGGTAVVHILQRN